MADFEFTEAFSVDTPEEFKPEDLEANAVVHFRPSSTWDGQGYGFDWMRICDYEHVSDSLRARGDKLKYKDSISFHYKKGTTELETSGNNYQGDFVNNPILFAELERVYQYNRILKKILTDPATGAKEAEKYYCSWMSMYPDAAPATISMIIEILTDDIPKSFKFSENEYIGCSLAQSVSGLVKGMNYLKDSVTVQCKKEYRRDQVITIFAVDENDEERPAGRLYFWANHAKNRKKAKVVSVRVQTKVQTTGSTPIMVSNDPILANKDVTQEYLRQSYIEFKEDIVVNLDCTDDEFKNLYITPEGIIGYYFTRALPYRNEAKERWDWGYEKAPAEFRRMTDVLRDRLHDQEGSKYDDYQHVYYFSEPGGGAYFDSSSGTEVRKLKMAGGYADDNKTIIMFKNPSKFMVAHELGHAFSLEHTFSNKAASSTAEFTYKAKTTDILMDYSHNASPRIEMVCFSYWQWKIMNKSVLSDGNINKLN